MRELAAVLIVIGFISPALGSDPAGLGSRNAALSGSVSTACNDGNAAWYNPAALAAIDSPVFTLSYAWMLPSLDASVSNFGSLGRIDGHRVEEEGSPSEPGTRQALSSAFAGAADREARSGLGISFVIPFHALFPRLPLAVSLGGSFLLPEMGGKLAAFASHSPDEPFFPTWNRPFGQARINFALGVEVWKDIAWLGGGAAVHSKAAGRVVTLTPIAAYDAADPEGNPPTPSQASTTQELELETVPTAGVLVRPVSWLGLALVYHGEEETAIEMDIDATMELNLGHPMQVELPYVLSGNFAYQPHRVVGGLLFAPLPELTVTAEVTLALWEGFADELQVLSFHVADDAVDDESGTVYVEDFGSDFSVATERRPAVSAHNTLEPRAGVEYSLGKFVDLRLGYSYRPSPLDEDQEYRNLLLDNSWHSVTAGAGFLLAGGEPGGASAVLNAHLQGIFLRPRYNRVGKADEQGDPFARGVVLTEGHMLGFGLELATHF